MPNYKTQGKKGFLGEELRIELLSEIGNPLEAINKVVDFLDVSNNIRVKFTQYE